MATDYEAQYEARSRKFVRLGIIAGVIVAALITGIVVFYNATGYAPQSSYTLVYNGGPLDNNHYRSFHMPGEGRFYKGWLSTTYAYPATVRTYIVSKVAHEGDVKQVDMMTAKTGDSNEVQVETALTFRLVADQATLRKFHETYGLKFQAWTPEGWAEFLTQMVRQPIKKSLQTELKPYTTVSAMGQSVDASGSATGMMAIGAAVKGGLQKELDDYMGGHFVEIMDFQINDIAPSNQAIADAIAARTAAQQGVQTAKQNLEAAGYTAQANQKLADSLNTPGGESAVLMEGIRQGKTQISTIYVPWGSNFALPAK